MKRELFKGVVRGLVAGIGCAAVVFAIEQAGAGERAAIISGLVLTAVAGVLYARRDQRSALEGLGTVDRYRETYVERTHRHD